MPSWYISGFERPRGPIRAGDAASWSGVTTDLIHHWPLDDATISGTTATDIVGGLNGTITSTTAITSTTGPSGVAGTARIFDGTNVAITLASAPIADLTNDAQTVCIWVYVPDVSANGGGGDTNDFFLNIHDGTSSMGICFLTTGNISTPANFEICPGGAGEQNLNNATTAQPLSSATWTMLSYTYPGGNVNNTNVKLYANSTDVTTSNAASQAAVNTARNWGRRSSGSRVVPVSTRIGRTLIYNRALSATEILQNFNAK